MVIFDYCEYKVSDLETCTLRVYPHREYESCKIVYKQNKYIDKLTLLSERTDVRYYPLYYAVNHVSRCYTGIDIALIS